MSHSRRRRNLLALSSTIEARALANGIKLSIYSASKSGRAVDLTKSREGSLAAVVPLEKKISDLRMVLAVGF